MADLADLEQAIRERAMEIVANAAQTTLEVTQDACPVGTSDTAGTLRDSHAVDPPLDQGTVITVDIHADAPHAQFVAEGTSPHPIFPVTARALRFEVGGQVVFATRVEHPGTAANTEWWSEEALAARWSDALEGEVS